jgi:hypothetical protein
MLILLALPNSTKFSTALSRYGGQDADSPDERARLVQNVDGGVDHGSEGLGCRRAMSHVER